MQQRSFQLYIIFLIVIPKIIYKRSMTMLKIGTQEDCKRLAHLPLQIQVEVESIITRLNFHYGDIGT